MSCAEMGGAVLVRDLEACGGAEDVALLGQSAGTRAGKRGKRVWVKLCVCPPSVISEASIQQ